MLVMVQDWLASVAPFMCILFRCLGVALFGGRGEGETVG